MSSHSNETVACPKQRTVKQPTTRQQTVRQQTAQKQDAAGGRAHGLEAGWNVTSYLLAGMAAYGGIGWLIGRAVHVSLLFPLGMLLGLGISLGYIIYRFGKQQVAQQKFTQQKFTQRPRKEMTGDR